MLTRCRRLPVFISICLLASVGFATHAATVQGFVKDEMGTGVAGVSVTFRGDSVGSQPAVLTDALGSYVASVPLDTYRITFIPPAATRLLPDRLFDVVVAADLSVPDFTVHPGVFVSGLVTDTLGTPVANVDLDFEDRVSGSTVFTPNDDTDATGQFSILVPTGSYEVEFRPPEFPAYVPQLIEQLDVAADLVLPTTVLVVGAAVTGRVIDEQGTPVPDVRLDFFDAADDKVFTLRDDTNEFGIYRVVVTPGVYKIRFLPPSGSRLLAVDWPDVQALTDVNLPDLTLIEGLELTGRVVDPAGLPVEDVDLDAFGSDGQRKLTPRDDTEADGTYRLVLPPDTYQLRYKPPAGSRLLPLKVFDVVLTEDLVRPDVELAEGLLVSGFTAGPSAEPVAGVDIDFVDEVSGEFLLLVSDDTDAAGQFAIPVPPGSYRVTFAPPQNSNYVPVLMENLDVDADLDLGEVLLELGWGISGTVVDGGSSPVVEMDVDVLDGSGEEVFIEYDETDEAGAFRVVVLPGTYQLALDPDAGSRLFPLLTGPFAVMSDVDLGTLTMESGVFVDGRVVDSSGTPIDAVQVTIEESSSPEPDRRSFEGETDAAGEFRVLVAPGDYVLRYEPSPGSPFLDLEVGPVSITVDAVLADAVLEDAFAVSGTVVDDAMVGVKDVDVDVLDAATGTSIPLQNDMTDVSGFFNVNVPAGTYQVRLEPAGNSGFFPLVTGTFTVPPDADLGTLVLVRGANVEGTVVDPLGGSVNNVDVAIFDAVAGGDPVVTTQTNGAGRFDAFLFPGDYLFEFDPPQGSTLLRAVVGPLSITGDTVLGPTVLPQGWMVSGIAVDPTMAGVGGVDVDAIDSATGASIPLEDDLTDGSGAFNVLVPAGTYRVRLEPDPNSRLLPLLSPEFAVGPDFDLGSLMFSTGVLLQGGAEDEGGLPIEGVSIKLYDSVTGLDVLLVGDRTDVTGRFTTAVETGDYFIEYRPQSSTRLRPLLTGPVSISEDTSLANVVLQAGVLVSGTVIDVNNLPVEGAETVWLPAGLCEPVYTIRDSTDALGRFAVVLDPATYDVAVTPPAGSGLFPQREFNVAVVDQDVVIPTLTLLSTPITGESCDGVDNDCDGIVDQMCPDIRLLSEGAEFSWNVVSEALSYDAVEGDLATLRLGDLSPTACLADNEVATSIAGPADPVLAGQGSWVLIRWNSMTTPDTYGSPARDAAIDASAEACPP